MKHWRDGWLWTIGLLSGGLLLLAWNLDLFVAYEPWPQYILAVVLGGVGITFFVGYVTTPEQWWRLIPGWTMLALATMLFLSTLPAPPVRIIAALLFWGMALAFGQIYWLHRIQHWWAIIPGGFMLVLGAAIAISGVVADLELLGAFLFVGMGAVFYLLYGLTFHARQWWALIPASVLCLFGLFIAVAQYGTGAGILRWWPFFLVLMGLGTGWRTYRTPAPPRTTTARPAAKLPSIKLPTFPLGWRRSDTSVGDAPDLHSTEPKQATARTVSEISPVVDDRT